MRAVVVGASSGLGRCIGVGPRASGASRSRCSPAATTAWSTPPRKRAPARSPSVCDVTDEASCRGAIEEAAAGLGGIDALVYATGIGPLARLEDLDAATWRRAFDTNVDRRVAWSPPPRSRTCRRRSGAAAYLSSVSASLTPPWPGLAAYLVSKAALDKMVEAWRTEHPERRLHAVSSSATAPAAKASR